MPEVSWSTSPDGNHIATVEVEEEFPIRLESVGGYTYCPDLGRYVGVVQCHCPDRPGLTPENFRFTAFYEQTVRANVEVRLMLFVEYVRSFIGATDAEIERVNFEAVQQVARNNGYSLNERGPNPPAPGAAKSSWPRYDDQGWPREVIKDLLILITVVAVAWLMTRGFA